MTMTANPVADQETQRPCEPEYAFHVRVATEYAKTTEQVETRPLVHALLAIAVALKETR